MAATSLVNNFFPAQTACPLYGHSSSYANPPMVESPKPYVSHPERSFCLQLQEACPRQSAYHGCHEDHPFCESLSDMGSRIVKNLAYGKVPTCLQVYAGLVNAEDIDAMSKGYYLRGVSADISAAFYRYDYVVANTNPYRAVYEQLSSQLDLKLFYKLNNLLENAIPSRASNRIMFAMYVFTAYFEGFATERFYVKKLNDRKFALYLGRFGALVTYDEYLIRFIRAFGKGSEPLTRFPFEEFIDILLNPSEPGYYDPIPRFSLGDSDDRNGDINEALDGVYCFAQMMQIQKNELRIERGLSEL